MSASASAIQDAMGKLSKSLVDVEKAREDRELAKFEWMKTTEERRLQVQSVVSESMSQMARALCMFVERFPVRKN